MPGSLGSTDKDNGLFANTKAADKVGVFGSNEATAPPAGGGAGGAGVFGLSVSPGAAGVFGANNSTNGVGVQGNGPEAGVSGFSDKHVGVQGNGAERGVSGFSQNGAGVVGQSTAANGVLATSVNSQGVTAFSDNDVGLFAQGGTFGAVFKGALVVGKGPGPKNPDIKRNDVDGSIVINDGGSLFLNGGGDVILGNADCAEDFDIINADSVDGGTVMVLGESGILEPSQFAYDKRVAGVISGAGDYKPGIVLDRQGPQPNRKPIALVGKVYCKVDAQYGAIETGDLLTTSPTPGHAMKATDQQKAFGAVIGKALRPLKEGQHLVPILIALQ
jgi:hypothetical protein